jgi:hypothetical protein
LKEGIIVNRVRTQRSKSPARGSARGAAMLEGIIVLTTMLVFLGLIVWTRNAYGLKLDMQQQARSNVLHHASNGCEDGGNGGGPMPMGDLPGAGTEGPSNGAATATRSWNSTSVSTTGRATGSAIVNRSPRGIRVQRSPLVSNVTADSNCVCNERKYNSQLSAWIRFAADMARRGGGAANIFR